MGNSIIKILAIDDNQDNLVILKALIQEAFPHAITLTALNGRTGIELASSENPDVILLDIVMPDMDGFEVCKKLKADIRLSDIPVVFVTAIKGDKEHRIHALEVGAEAFLAKPIDETELTAEIRAMVKIKKANNDKRNEKERLVALVNESTSQLQQELEERKQAENQLLMQKMNLNALFESSPIAMYVIDETTNIVMANLAAIKHCSNNESDILQHRPGHALQCIHSTKDPRGCGFSKDCKLCSVRTTIDRLILEGGAIHEAEVELELIKHEKPQKVWMHIGIEPLMLDGKSHWCIAMEDITKRKQTEQALIESEQKFSNAFMTSPYAITITNPTDGKFIEVNDIFCTYTGYTREESYADSSVGLNLWFDLKDRDFAIKELMEGRGVAGKEFLFRKKNGELINGLYSAQVIKLNNEPYILSSINDITERIHAEEKVREKDIQFRKLSASLPDLIFQFTRKPDGSYYVPIASAGIKNIFGCSPEDVLNDFTPIARVIHPDDAARVISDIEYSAKHLTYFTCEFRVQIPGKETQWIFARSNPEELPDGSITWYGSNTDITEIKKAEEALEKHRLLLNATGEMAKVGGWEIDLLKETLIWTEELYRIHEVSNDFQPTVEGAINFYTRDSKIKISAAVQKAMELGEMFDLELQIITAKGAIRDVHAVGKPISKDNTVLKVMGTFQDISERKMAEKELVEKDAFNYTLFQSNPIATIIVDNEGTILDINQKQRTINSDKPKLGNVMYHDYAANHSIDMYTELMQCISKKDTRNFSEMKYDNKYLNISIAPLNNGAIITCIDITERKRAEETLNQKVTELGNFNDLMVGRENKMVELKKEINELLIKLGEQEKYEIAE